MNLELNNFSYTSTITTKTVKPKNINQLRNSVKKKHTVSGSRRSYGDSFIGKYLNISMSNFNKILHFDKKKGIIEVQSGVILDKINKNIIPKGFILDCSPGCKYVSVGGMISNNISGKLSKKNTISSKVISIKILDKHFKIKECTKKKNKNIFHLAIGGKGRVGPILSAVLKLKKLNSDKIFQTSYYFENYQGFTNKIKHINSNDYCVVWINFLKENFSGIYFCGNHVVSKGVLKYKNNDIKLPSIVLFILSYIVNNKTFSLFFNFLFEKLNLLSKKKTMHLIDYFFPQNKIINWNKVFKKEGFIQFHFFFYKRSMKKIIYDIKKTFIENKIYSNFAILKFHSSSKKKIKMSLSLDIPIKDNFDLVKSIINKIVEKHNLEVNLSKDIILNRLNLKTFKSNQIFNVDNKKYFMKTNTSNLIERLTVKNES